MHAAGDRDSGFGFYTVVQSDEGGFAGGLLVLNANGRPLEFHCTAIIKPSRPQEILYGPTLTPYLFGDQIGPTLVSKVKSSLALIFTDEKASHSMRRLIDVPLIFVPPDPSHDQVVAEAAGDHARPEDSASPAESERRFRLDAEHRGVRPPVWLTFEHDGRRLACADFATDRGKFSELMEGPLKYLDLSEPFGRVREAVAETLKTGRA